MSREVSRRRIDCYAPRIKTQMNEPLHQINQRASRMSTHCSVGSGRGLSRKRRRIRFRVKSQDTPGTITSGIRTSMLQGVQRQTRCKHTSECHHHCNNRNLKRARNCKSPEFHFQLHPCRASRRNSTRSSPVSVQPRRCTRRIEKRGNPTNSCDI